MSQLLELMAAPFVACVVLVGIHAYLGLHVIRRKVIFVDLALAQIAALGATFSFLIGISPHGRGAYLFSLGFAVVGAAIFSLTRMRHERIPQEAIIGIVYAVAMAMAILVADRAPEGAEHIKETLVGAILWVTWPTVLKTAAIYSLVGGLHVLLRKRFFQISFAPDRAFAEGRKVRVWDFIFYVTFALVITSSVSIAGVLLVFSFLVIPAVISTLFAQRIALRLAIGWTVGIAACLIGLLVSYHYDMPSGPTVVASLGLSLVLAALLRYVINAESRAGALVKAATGVAIVVVAVVGVGALLVTQGERLHIPHEHEWERPADPVPAGAATDVDALAGLSADCGGDLDCVAAALAQRSDWKELLAARLESDDPTGREQAIGILARVQLPGAAELIAEAARTEAEPLIRLDAARALVAAGDHRGLEIAVDMLGRGSPLLVRDEAHQLLLGESGREFGYDPQGSEEDNAAAIDAWRRWVAAR